MIPYLFLLFYIIIICSLKFQNKKVTLLLCLIPFFAFMASQQGWTPDYDEYEMLYDEAQYNWQVSYFALKLEFLYAWLEHIMPSYRMLIITQMTLYTISLYILFVYHIPRKYWTISFILFWLDYNMLMMSVSAIRSCIVASLFIIAYHLRSMGYRILPFFLVLMSVFFHKSAILLLPFIFIPKHLNKQVLKLIMILTAVLAVMVFVTPSTFNHALNAFLNDSEEFSSYANYTDAQALTIGGLLVRLISIFCVFYVISVAARNQNYDDFVFICAISILLLRVIPNIGSTTRFMNYFGPILLVCNAKILQMDRTNKSYLYVGVLILFAVYHLFNSLPSMGAWESYKNYKSVLF